MALGQVALYQPDTLGMCDLFTVLQPGRPGSAPHRKSALGTWGENTHGKGELSILRDS